MLDHDPMIVPGHAGGDMPAEASDAASPAGGGERAS